MKYNIDEQTYQRCVKFANDSVKTNIDEYSRRNQNNIDKIIDDIIIGKMGEFGAYSMLIEKGFTLNEPDLSIYDKKHKSFDADLKTDKFNIHVKSQNIQQKTAFTTSWLFQSNDKLVTKPDDKDIIVFCQVDGREVEILFYQKAKLLKGLYRDPKKESLRGNKKAIYYQDILNIINKK